MILNKKVTNALVFQLGWFACIMLDAILAVAFTVGALVLHFYYTVDASRRLSELCFIVSIGLIGAVFETLYLLTQVLVSNGGELFPPVWLLMLWLLFASTLNHSLGWLKSKPWLAGLLTAISAPWSYYAGVHLKQSVEFGLAPLLSLLVIGLSWSLLMIVTFKYLARK